MDDLEHAIAKIHVLAKAGAVEEIKQLLDRLNDEDKVKCVNKETPKPEEYTPLILACNFGHFEVVKYLIKVGSIVQPVNGAHFPLRAACIGGHLDIVTYLLEQGAEVNQVSKGNRTPLQGAVFYNHPSLIPILLSNGADMYFKNDFNENSIEIAELKGYSEISELLKEKLVKKE